MDKYKKVPKEKEQAPENEIKISSKSRIGNYVRYGRKLLTTGEHKDIKITCTGNAIAKGVIVAEILIGSIGDLHQITKFDSMEIEDKYEPTEEGLEPVTVKRRVSMLSITLSKEPLDTADPGYQAPRAKVEETFRRYRRTRRGGYRGSDRGGRGRGGRGRGRGRGRGGRGGRGRGGAPRGTR